MVKHIFHLLEGIGALAPRFIRQTKASTGVYPRDASSEQTLGVTIEMVTLAPIEPFAIGNHHSLLMPQLKIGVKGQKLRNDCFELRAQAHAVTEDVTERNRIGRIGGKTSLVDIDTDTYHAILKFRSAQRVLD